jgi:diguanylate cyclase (GGDEF)-like protein
VTRTTRRGRRARTPAQTTSLDRTIPASLLEGRVGRVTVSAGVAASVAGALDERALFEAADRAVYRAKHAGRDRVEVA